MTTDVLLYTTNWCPFCRRAKALLKEKGVRWKELDIEADPAHRQAMAEASGRSSVPQIFINGTLIGGSDELFALDVRGELDKLRTQPACHLRRCGLGQPAREPSPVDEYKRRVRWSQPSGKTLLSPQATKQSSSREITTSHRQEST